MKLVLKRLLIFLVVLTMVIPAGLAYAATDDGNAEPLGDEPVVTENPLEGEEGDVASLDAATLHVPKLGDKAAQDVENEEPSQEERTSAEITLEEIAEMDGAELNKTVRVSIFMDDKAVLDKYGMKDVNGFGARNFNARLVSNQAKVEKKINAALGKDLKVKWRFTLAVNAISAEATYADIAKILEVEGVRSVELERKYQALDDVTVADPDTSLTSSEMVGATETWAAGYTGAGQLIAIIDTGIDIDHQSFDPGAFQYAISLEEGDVDLRDAGDIPSDLSGAGQYINAKVPYAYNYVDQDMDIVHVNDTEGEHGSHVAGIAAANKYVDTNGDGEYEDAASTVYAVGMAPNAQLAVMKVFGKDGGAYDSDYMSAIQDAILLQCDACNLSLGSAAPGYTFAGEYQNVMNKLSSYDNNGMVVSISAGNSGAWAENLALFGEPFMDDINFDTVGSPGSFTNAFTVASADNVGTTGRPMNFDNANLIYPADASTNNGKISDKPGDYDYVYIDALGYVDEYEAVDEAVDLEGKLVIINRGTITFVMKANDAIGVDPLALIIANDRPGAAPGMALDDYTGTFPIAGITQIDANTIKANAANSATIENVEIEPYYDEDEGGYVSVPVHDVTYYTGTVNITDIVSTNITTEDVALTEMSDFSSWGVPGSLTLKPEITAPGGNIYSVAGTNQTPQGAIAGGTTEYELMSGTSMAAPHIAGLSALLLQKVADLPFDLCAYDLGVHTYRAIAQSLLMSTAVPMKPYEGEEDGWMGYLPVIQQGAGLVNVLNAVSAGSVIMMDEAPITNITGADFDGKVKAELGDDPKRTGDYTYSFNIYNITDQEQEYNLYTDMFTQYIDQDYGTLTGYTEDLDAKVSYIWGDADPAHDVNKDGTTDFNDAQAILDYLTGNVDGEELDLEAGEMDEDGKITSQDAKLLLEDYGKGYVLPAYGEVNVTVNIKVDVDDELYANGAYIEGFTYAECDTVTDEGEIIDTVHSIPILGYYGSWTDPSMYDQVSFYDYLDYLYNYGVDISEELVWEDEPYTYLDALTYTGNYLTNFLMLKRNGENFIFTGNPYAVEEEFPADKLAISTDTKMEYFRYNLIRDAGTLGIVVNALDENNNVTEPIDASIKLTNTSGLWYNDSSMAAVNVSPKRAGVNAKAADYELKEYDKFRVGLYAAPEYYGFEYNGTGADAGSGVLDLDSFVDAVNSKALGSGAGIEYDFTVDDTAPVIDAESLTWTDDNTISVNVSDNLNLAWVAAMDIYGSEEGLYDEITAPEAGTMTLDLTDGLDNELGWIAVFAGDYAGNETALAVRVNDNADEVDPGKVTAVSVSPNEISLVKGMNYGLVVDVLPITSEDKTVTWTTSDPGVVTVNEFGEITAIEVGTATVTATSNSDNTISGECEVTVINPELTGVINVQNYASFKPGDVPNFTVKGTPRADWMNSIFVDKDSRIVGGTFVQARSTTLYTLNPSDFKETRIGNNFVPAMDTAPGLYYKGVDENGEEYEIDRALAYTYGPYFILGNLTPASGTTGQPYILGSWPDSLGADTYLSGVALAGYWRANLNEAGTDYIDFPAYFLLDDTGKIWYTETDLDAEGFFLTEPELVADTGLATNWYWQGFYFDGTYIYWTQWDGESDYTNMIIVDPASGELQDLGNFGYDNWPFTGLFEMPGAKGANTELGTKTLDADAVNALAEISANAELAELDTAAVEERIAGLGDIFAEDEADAAPAAVEEEAVEEVVEEEASGSLDAFTSPAVSMKPELDGPVVIPGTEPKDEEALEPVVTIDVAYEQITTNGLVKVTYSPELTLTGYESMLTYESINVDEENGTITFAYANKEDIAANTVLASFYFIPPCEDATATATTLERNSDLNLSETETYNLEGTGHAWDEPDWEWADDYSAATATFICNNNPEHEVTLDAAITADGNTYTATVTGPDGEVYTDTVVAGFDGVMRIFGSGRYETAFKVANALKEQLGVDKFDAVILAFGSNYPDALAGSYLSAVLDAPILLVNSQEARIAAVQEYINENLEEGGTVYMLGGTGVVPDAAVEGLTGFETVRLGGNDRYETNLKILEEAAKFDPSADEVLVCTGSGFADSLSAAAAGKPIMLVRKALRDDQKEYLADLGEGFTFTAIGGTGAVSEEVMTEIAAYGDTDRAAGENRYQTSVAVAQKYFESPQAAVLAYGSNFPDGLCGGVLAYTLGGPLVLTNDKNKDTAAEYAASKDILGGVVLGGTGLISDESVRAIFQMAEDDEIIIFEAE